MSNSAHPDLIKITELFLIPSSFLVAAIGTADTNLHRAAVSILGLIADGLWIVAVQDAYRQLIADGIKEDEVPRRTHVLKWLPWVFGFGWLVSSIVHFAMWNKPLGTIG